MTTLEMIVNIDCEGCERKVRKALQNLDGVESIDIDMNMQKVTVTGYVDQEKVLKKIRRTGKKAELWPFPYNQESLTFSQQYADMYSYHSDPATYFHTDRPERSTYDYNGHGYDRYGGHVTYQESPYSSMTGIGEKATTAFNDENVNACSIMWTKDLAILPQDELKYDSRRYFFGGTLEHAGWSGPYTVELIVNMDCHGCEKKVRRALENLDGVDSIEIDKDQQKVTVTGWAEQEDVLKVVRNTGRNAELWPFPYSLEYFGFTEEYANLYPYHSDPTTYFQAEQPNTSFRHHVQGYNGQEHYTHQELPNLTIHGSQTPFVAFSDENVNACLIM